MVNWRKSSDLRQTEPLVVLDRSLQSYLQQFASMNRNVMRGYVAPHKPLLLMAVCDLIAERTITSNNIPLSEELVHRFAVLWSHYVDNGSNKERDLEARESLVVEEKAYPFRCTIEKPYYHLGNEPFWHLEPNSHWVPRRDYSVAQLRRCFRPATLDGELYALLLSSTAHDTIYNQLKSLL